MRKKLLSFVLSIIMVFSLVPASAFAAADFEPPYDGYELVWSEDFESYASESFEENEELGFMASTDMPEEWAGQGAYVVETGENVLAPEGSKNSLFLNGKDAKVTIKTSDNFDLSIGKDYYLTFDYWTLDGKNPGRKLAAEITPVGLSGGFSGVHWRVEPSTEKIQNKIFDFWQAAGYTVKLEFYFENNPAEDVVAFIDNIALWKPKGGETKYKLWVGNTQVTSANAENVLSTDTVNNGKISFDAATNTLTLDGANIDEGLAYSKGGKHYPIYGKLDELNIKATGKSSIIGTYESTYSSNYCGIYNEGAINIEGDSNLTINLGKYREEAQGIYATEGITVSDNVKITIQDTTYDTENKYIGLYSPETIELKGDSETTVDINNSHDYVSGIEADVLKVSEDAVLDIKSNKKGISHSVASGSGFKQTGGRVTVNAAEEGIYMDNFEFGGGSLNVTSEKTALHTADTLKFTGGTAELFGKEKAIDSGNAKFDFSGFKNYAISAGESAGVAEKLSQVPATAEEIGVHKYYKIEKTAAPAQEYDLWISGVQVTSTNADDVLKDGTVSFDDETNTLTLSGANITGKHVNRFGASIFSNLENLVIKVEGNNTIDSPKDETTTSYRGIYSSGNLTICGTGSLDIAFASDWNYIYGIDSVGLLTIEEDVSIKMENVVSGTAAYGINAEGGIKALGNSKLDITLTRAANASTAIKAINALEEFEVLENTEITISTEMNNSWGIFVSLGGSSRLNYIQKGGKVNVKSADVGIEVTNFDFSGGTLNVVSNDKALCVNGKDSVTSFTGGNAEFFAKTGVTVYEPKAITFSDVEVKGGSSSEAAQPIKIPTSAEDFAAYPYFAVSAKTAPSEYNLWLGKIQVTEANKEDILIDNPTSAKFDPTTNTLTLSNAGFFDLDGALRTVNGKVEYVGIYADMPNLIINLENDNILTMASPTTVLTRDYAIAIASTGNITFTGGGTIHVDVPKANFAKDSGMNMGIFAEGNLTFGKNTTVNVNTMSGNPGDKVGFVYGVISYGKCVVQESAELNITTSTNEDSYKESTYFIGAMANGFEIKDSAEVQVYSSYVGIESDSKPYTQNGGTVRITSEYAGLAVEGMEFTGGSLIADGEEVGLSVAFSSKKFEISNGIIEATGGLQAVYLGGILPDTSKYTDMKILAGESKDIASEITSLPNTADGYKIYKYLKIYSENYEPEEKYNLWIGETQVTNKNAANVLAGTVNDGKVKFDAKTNTLTLSGANITEKANMGVWASVYSKLSELNIKLEGENTVGAPFDGSLGYSGYNGIYSEGTLTFVGEGTLNLNIAPEWTFAYGIGSKGLLTIGDKVTIKTDHQAKAGTHEGIFAEGGLTIGGNANINLKMSGGGTIGICAAGDFKVTENAKVDIVSDLYCFYQTSTKGGFDYVQDGGEVKLLSTGSYCIYAKNFDFKDGKMTAVTNYWYALFLLGDKISFSGGSAEFSGNPAIKANKDSLATIAFEGVTVKAGDSAENAAAIKAPTNKTELEAHKYYKIEKTTVEPEKYDLWVGGIQVTSENASDVLGNGKISFNESTKTLTLDNAEITTYYKKDIATGSGQTDSSGFMIYSGLEDLTVELEGTSKMLPSNVSAGELDNCYGLYSEHNVTIKGNGIISIPYITTVKFVCGLGAYGDLTIEENAKILISIDQDTGTVNEIISIGGSNITLKDNAYVQIRTIINETLGNQVENIAVFPSEKIEILGDAQLLAGSCGYGIFCNGHGTKYKYIQKGGSVQIAAKKQAISVDNVIQEGGYLLASSITTNAISAGSVEISDGTGELYSPTGTIDSTNAPDFSKYKTPKFTGGEDPRTALEVTSFNALYKYFKYEKANTPGTKYTLTVNGGTGSGEFEKDEIVMIEANAAETGKLFKEWIGLDSVEFVEGTSKTSVTAKFKMPAEAVAATATYEDVISGEKYTVTAYGLYGDTMIITPGTTYKADYAKDERVALQIGKRSGYTLKDLTLVGISESDLTWTAKNEEINDRGISFTMPDHSVTITVNWTKINSGSSGGGGSSATKYAVTVSSADNGKVTLDKTSAAKGSVVTITTKANDGYALGIIKATDKDGKEIKLTDKGDGKYTFTMPASKVEVKAAFKQNASKPDQPAEETKTVVVIQIGSKTMFVNGKAYEKDVAPVIMNDRTLVPIRFVTESLGGKVAWNEKEKEVVLTIDGKEIKMTIGKVLEKYGVAPVILNDRTYMPVRFVADELGATTTWDAVSKMVMVTKIEK